MPRKESSCLVTVGTTALKSAGIFPDDVVIMERGRVPQEGDIVIAEIDGSPIIRRFEKKSGLPCLVDDTGVREIKEDCEVRILGVVVSAIRRYR